MGGPAGGPSPRLRGSQLWNVLSDAIERSIPASAGLTGSGTRPMSQMAVHPRVCGAHRVWSATTVETTGPSPRLRGSRPDSNNKVFPQRSIPASAGLTASGAVRRPVVTVHPRVCGAHAGVGDLPRADGGPSPRLRGSPGVPTYQDLTFRSIPASAGLTVNPAFEAGGSTVHPRVCGAHAAYTGLSGALIGPSPRLRGSLRESTHRSVKARSIPASAGLTANDLRQRQALSSRNTR